MGKKGKNKGKISGNEKTALKTEKKLMAKQKKELAALGEDDIEKVVAEIEREEAKRQRVVEKTVEPPSPRVNFTLTAHPFKDELVMFGGEFYDGKTTTVYGELYFFDTNKNEWSIVRAPGAPPPRCGHQAVSVPSDKGELWVFGGEFSSPSGLQFFHYRDLWVYRIGEKKWERIASTGGPSARSGHRMILMKRQLFVFGGFHDNARDYKYYNDLYVFNLGTYTWNKLAVLGNLPAPRSGCIVLPTPENKILIYGGYSKERIRKDVDKGHIHTDMFLLSPEKNEENSLNWKGALIKQTGTRVSPRCSASGILVQPNLAYMFGGVFDEEESEEELRGIFYNDLIAFDLNKFQWKTVRLCGKKDSTAVRRRRRAKNEGDDNAKDAENDEISNSKDEESTTTLMDTAHVPTVSTTGDDGIFTVTVGPTLASNRDSTKEGKGELALHPSPRINPGLALKHGVLYLYGGMVEDGDRQYTLNDFYSLDLRKLDEWKVIVENDLSSQIWLDSGSSSSESCSEDESSSEKEDMDVD